MILDIGPKSAAALAELLKAAGTVVWNGPVGVFEFDQFAGGTKALAEAIAQSKAFSIAGGGDTLAAIAKFGVTDKSATSPPAAARPRILGRQRVARRSPLWKKRIQNINSAK